MQGVLSFMSTNVGTFSCEDLSARARFEIDGSLVRASLEALCNVREQYT